MEKSPYVKNCNNLYSCKKHPISFQKAILKQASVVFSTPVLSFIVQLLTQVLRMSNSCPPVSNQQKPTHETSPSRSSFSLSPRESHQGLDQEMLWLDVTVTQTPVSTTLPKARLRRLEGLSCSFLLVAWLDGWK